MTEDTGDRATPRSPQNGGSRPVPDPTELTDRALLKLERSLTEYIDGKAAVLAERMAGHWRLDDERWAEFKRSDERESHDAKDAVIAAISAQKEAASKQEESNAKAIDKSEKATAEAIGKLEQLFKTTTDALRDKIEDVRTTANATVQQKVGGTENRTATYALMGAVALIIGLGITIIGFVLRGTP